MAHWIELRIEPAPRLTAFGPGWAAICGAIASGGLAWSIDKLSALVLGVVLVDPLLQGVWTALEALADAIARRSGLQPGDRPGQPTSTEHGQPAARLPYVMAWDRWRKTIWPVLLALIVGPPLVAAIALRLGHSAPLLVAASAVLVLVALALSGPDTAFWRLTRAAVEVGLGWAMGYSAVAVVGWAPPADASVLEAIAAWWSFYAAPTTVGALFVLSHAAWLALPVGASPWRIRALNAGQAGVAVALVVFRQPVAAAGVAFAALGQALFQPWIGALGPVWYVQRTQWLLMAAMLIAALGIAHRL